jgi:hypothetical protein
MASTPYTVMISYLPIHTYPVAKYDSKTESWISMTEEDCKRECINTHVEGQSFILLTYEILTTRYSQGLLLYDGQDWDARETFIYSVDVLSREECFAKHDDVKMILDINHTDLFSPERILAHHENMKIKHPSLVDTPLVAFQAATLPPNTVLF